MTAYMLYYNQKVNKKLHVHMMLAEISVRAIVHYLDIVFNVFKLIK
jgi:hypothetical protein